MATVDARGDEVVAQARGLLGAADARHRDLHPVARREPQRGGAVVREPDVAVAAVGERHPQARDRHAAERRCAASRIGPTSMPLNPSRVLVPTMPGPIATTAASASRDVARHRERGEHRHRFVVAAERVAAGDGGVDEVLARGASATRSDSASGSPAPSVIT